MFAPAGFTQLKCCELPNAQYSRSNVRLLAFVLLVMLTFIFSFLVMLSAFHSSEYSIIYLRPACYSPNVHGHGVCSPCFKDTYTNRYSAYFLGLQIHLVAELSTFLVFLCCLGYTRKYCVPFPTLHISMSTWK